MAKRLSGAEKRQQLQKLRNEADQAFANEVKKNPALVRLCKKLADGVTGTCQGSYGNKKATYTSNCTDKPSIKVSCGNEHTIFELKGRVIKPLRIVRQGESINLN